ncbi:hypothetical protein AAF712_006194 [Marasmius tenuissimus]|uniref:Uncharacterized protein n=1 Tax=Marasmius tenuissimus TaxID=585030 RepID=A0ABR3A0F4_9AGAR
MDSHISLSSSSPSSSAPPIARSLSLKDPKVNRQSNTPNRSRFSLNLNLLLPSPSLNKVSIPTSLESQLNGEGAEGRCRIVGITRKSRHARLAVPPSAMKYYDCSELCSSTEDEHDLVGGLSCFGSPKRKLQRTRTLSTRAYEKQPTGEETYSPAYRIQQEWRAKNEVLIRARSYSTRQLKVVTESTASSSGGCPPLPSPCEGLFESSRTTRRPLSLTIALPAPTTTGHLLSLPLDPDSRNPEEQGLPVPLPLSPLLSPALSHFETGCASTAGTEPPSPTVPSSPFRKLSFAVESSCGHYSLNEDSSCHRHKRWKSDSQSSGPCTPSTCSNQDPRLFQDIESVINYTGQKLRKTSSPPKMWAEPRIIREDFMEDELGLHSRTTVVVVDEEGGED